MSASNNHHTNAEELRHAALEVIASRHPTALAVDSVRRRIEKDHLVDFLYDTAELEAALALLAELELARVHYDELGSTQYYAATPKGVLAHERGTIAP